MKTSSKLLIGAFALTAVGTAAAADFNGYYGGLNVGGASGTSKAKTSTVFSPTGYFAQTSVPAVNSTGDQTVDSTGLVVSAVGGRNWVSGTTLTGIEAELGYFGLSDSTTKSDVYPCCAPTGYTVKSEVKTSYLITLRGRLGMVSNNWLYYATGGLALTDLKGTFSFSDNFATAAESASVSKTQVGWTLGFGAERAMNGPWSFKAEYLYADFGDASVQSSNLTAFTPPIAFPTNTFNHSIDLKVHMLRAGINYKF